MLALCWTSLCKCCSVFSRQVSSLGPFQHVALKQMDLGFMSALPAPESKQSIITVHTTTPCRCFLAGGFDTSLCTARRENDDYNPLKSSKSFCPKVQGILPKNKSDVYICVLWLAKAVMLYLCFRTQPKQVEMEGLLALEVTHKADPPQGRGASVLPVVLKNQVLGLSELPFSLHWPWR